MFTKEMTNLTLTSRILNNVFPNITGTNFGYDESFLATLRALIYRRIKPEDCIRVDLKLSSRIFDFIKDKNGLEAYNAISVAPIPNSILIVGFNGGEKNRTRSMEIINNEFIKLFPGFVELLDLHEYSRRQSLNIRYFINEKDKSVAVFAEELNLKVWHFIQSFTSRLLPWYFNNCPLAEDEKGLLKSLTNKTSTTYLRLIEAMAEKFDLRGIKIEGLLKDFDKKRKANSLSLIKNEIYRQESDMNRWMQRYMDGLKVLEDLRIKESGLEYQIREGDIHDSELIDFFKNNHHVNILSVDDNYIKIIIDTTLENYDPEMFERMCKNEKSYLFEGYTVTEPTFESKEARKKLLNAIFGEDSLLKIKVCAYYCIDVRGGVMSSTGFAYTEIYKDFLVNPHIKYHACIGNNRPIICNFLKKGDYISGITQCQVSAMNLNLSEGSQTVAPFLGELFSNNCKNVILMPDGTSCTPRAAYNWLLSQENNTTENEHKQED